MKAVDELAAFAAGGAAGDGGWLAPAGISTLLGVEESAPILSFAKRSSESLGRRPVRCQQAEITGW